MKDQGFAVAPGSHTLVGIKKYEVIDSEFLLLSCFLQIVYLE